MADAMEFGFLLDPERRLLSIGYRVADGTLDPSCYDLLASEARLASFVAIERRAKDPLLPLAFFRSRNFSATLLTNAATSAGYMGSFVIAPFFLFYLDFSPTAASFLILLRTGALTIGSPMGGTLGVESEKGLGTTFTLRLPAVEH